MDISTAKHAMEASIRLLGNIPVPVAQYESIGLPIHTAINNLVIGLKALNEEEPEKKTEEGQDNA